MPHAGEKQKGVGVRLERDVVVLNHDYVHFIHFLVVDCEIAAHRYLANSCVETRFSTANQGSTHDVLEASY